MSEIAIILVLLLGALVIGAALFFPMRWLFTRNATANRDSPRVTASGYLQVALVVAVLLVLIWYKEAGNKAAGIVFATLMLIATIVGGFLVHKAKRRKDESGP